jgi:hypothetical protein
MRNLDGSLEHGVGTSPPGISVEHTFQFVRPTGWRLVGCAAIGFSLLAQLSFVGYKIHEGLSKNNHITGECTTVDPLELADTFETAARITVTYDINNGMSYEETLATLLPCDDSLDICGREKRIYDILLVNKALGIQEPPPIIPEAQVLDN